MMVINAEMGAIDANERAFKRRLLQNAVICMGWTKLISIICYIILFYFVYTQSKGEISNILQVMIVVIIPFQVLHGGLLFLGALQGQIIALQISLWLCLLLASFNTALGVVGCMHFIRTGYMTIHFFLSVIFALLAISLFTVLCHDILIVYAYIRIVSSNDLPPILMPPPPLALPPPPPQLPPPPSSPPHSNCV